MKLDCFSNDIMNYEDINTYDYELDESLIAQSPNENRDQCKLLVVDKNNGKIKDKKFYEITQFLRKGDILVLNDTKVLPSRIYGYKTDTNAKIEFLLLKELDENIWECLVRPQKRVHIGTRIKFSDDFYATITEVLNDGIVHAKFEYSGIFIEQLEKIGTMPLPPYIHEKLEDNNSYQTVYAKNLGSSAAPTAGLHFTNELLDEIKNMGVKILYVTLNVGLGTFRPVSENNIKNHDMHSEVYYISEEVSKELNNAKENGNRIICVGTTSLRTLEANYSKYGKFKAVSESTNIFIYPPYKIKSADALITNFHLPKSTLVMLVSAFSSVDIIKKSYKYAMENGYKFFSFGDAMFLTEMEDI